MPIKHVEWRTILKWVLVPIVIGFSIHMSYLTKSWLRAKEMRVGGPIPYIVILHETIFRPDRSSMRSVELTQAIRSDGSFAWRSVYEKGDDENEVVPQEKIHKERNIRFASGIQVLINELTNTKSTVVNKDNPARWQRDPNSKCINSFAGTPMVSSPTEVISGEEAVAGYRAVKIKNNNITWWFALDVGCAMVKASYDWGKQGSGEKNLSALIPGEPEAALFDVPADIREAPPSERMPRPGVTLQPKDIDLFRRLDEEYYKNRVVK